MSLQGQIALITGASRGIGQGIAMELGSHGATVIGTATTEVGAKAISDYMAAASICGCGVMLDVNSVTQIDQVIADIRKKYGEISILVNNAGVTRDNLLVRMTDEEWDGTISTNLTSVFRMSRSVLRAMIKARHGRIVNISSVVGSMGNAGQANYAASKAGMIGFSKSLAREIGGRNITVNCVAPGFIITEMTEALSQEQRDSLVSSVPLKRLGQVADVAAAVAFLVGPGATYITGATLHVNGGMYME
ncbi:MAG: 3-oxoacyl-ACP reductase FabG [Candidatus Nitrotoga sp.]|jgi:3-oxoacyl-[acyl-carrier protein] reductase|nr:3-oxoacyl-ACP reductase FabG [Pseudomonadota bacterium]MDW7534945.1 3-oxoacyl-ACP reductase FabG [Candidatus Nitrotoga sp.]MDW7604920.1 3-oxoacyl-ACP reductase FabG [Candidatus Nitrotoga sp.]MDW7612853.1 3-oxoacyl-ACP reductase FabG [Candidatus Nitrotoga sp.]MDW7625543.1 3-oxoacyl-ACP reductase FabG [Candidatus Nitrotoga sp.]